MCRRGEVNARCREGSVVFADVGKVVFTAAWCRGRDAAAGCRRGDIAGRCREGDADVGDVGKETVPAPLVIGEGISHMQECIVYISI